MKTFPSRYSETITCIFSGWKSDYMNSKMFPRTLDSHCNKSEGRFGMRAPCFPLADSATFSVCILTYAAASTFHAYEGNPTSTCLYSKRCPLAGRLVSEKNKTKLRIRSDLYRRFHCPSMWLQPAYIIAHWPSMQLKTTTTVGLPTPRQEVFFKATQNTLTSGKGNRAPQ